MEGRDGGGASSGVTVVGSDAPSEYKIAPRTSDNPPQTGGSTPPPATQSTSTPSASAQVTAQPPPPTAASSVPGKKKRGRPRKYGPDGSVSMALSPKPISSSVPPPVIDFSTEKKGKVRPASAVSKSKFEVDNLGNGNLLI